MTGIYGEVETIGCNKIAARYRCLFMDISCNILRKCDIGQVISAIFFGYLPRYSYSMYGCRDGNNIISRLLLFHAYMD